MPSGQNHWESDDYSQAEADYTGSSDVSTPSRKTAKCSKEANSRKCAKWAKRNKAKIRERMRRYMAARRASQRGVAGCDEELP